MTDFELLNEYAKGGSDDAFAVLVKRYMNLVYSAAMRQARNPDSAEEITQAVFLILARKAGEIRDGAIFSAWLLRTTRFVALNSWRRETRRIKLEQIAMNLHPTEADTAWKQIGPVLDEALVSLSQKDRDAVALRFFEEKSFKEIGEALGLTEDGAQKRVSRAVDKLRSNFAKRGAILSAALVGIALAGRTVQAAPAQLATSVSAAVASGAAGPVSTLVQLTLNAWQTARLKALAVQGAAAALAVFLLLLTLHWFRSAPSLTENEAASNQLAISPAALENGAADGNAPVNELSRTNAGGLAFRVVDAQTGAPVIDARLTLVWTTDLRRFATNYTVTDRQGVGLLAIDRRPIRDWSFRIEIFRDGYVPKYVSWSEAQQDDIRDIPTEYVTKMTRAVEIGGVVLNEPHEPISGARVIFSGRLYAQETVADRERLTIGWEYHVETTDADGRWRCSHVPEDVSVIDFQVLHADYLSTSFGVAKMGATESQGKFYAAEADLRGGLVTNILKPGIVVAGIVVDEWGNPIADAKVTQSRNWTEPTASQFTGADGRFRFLNVLPSLSSLTVQAEGFAPMDRWLEPTNPAPPTASYSFAITVWTPQRLAEATAVLTQGFQFTLIKGAWLRGRLVDEQDRPVTGASIQIASRSKPNRFEWEAITDADGRFEWASAPPGPESYRISAPGYQPAKDLKCVADGTEHLVTLRTLASSTPVRLSGTAIDAESKRPLENFQVLLSRTQRSLTENPINAFVSAPSSVRVAGRNGQFSFTNTEADLQTIEVEAQADGHWPARLTGRGPFTNDQTFQFELKPGLVLDGFVQSADGRPIAGAALILCTEEPSSNPGQAPRRIGGYMTVPGQFDQSYSARGVKTDTNGHFSLPPNFAAKRILVTHPTGFAAMPAEHLAVSPVIVLQPWGRVAGTLKIGSRPGANEKISVSASQRSYEEWIGFSAFLETKTDADGSFALDGVPPGRYQVSHRLNIRNGQTGTIPNSQEQFIELKAGQTTHVALGGAGWKVVGKVKMPRPSPIDWGDHIFMLTAKTGEPPWSKGSSSSSAADRASQMREWNERLREYWESEEGQKSQRNWRRYVLEFAADGSFEIQDVLPGDYGLDIQFPGLPLVRRDVVIPEMTDETGVSVFDLGTIEVK